MSDGDPTAFVERVREVMLAIDPTVPPYAVGTTAQAAAREIATQRAVTLLSRLFSGSALLLTALGLYGLVGQSLARRRREMGIRLVMGARAPELVRAAMRRPLALTLLGLLIGVVGSLPAASLLAPLLFEVPARDPVVFGAVIVGIVFVAAVAAYLPARRVLRLDPCESLRVD